MKQVWVGTWWNGWQFQEGGQLDKSWESEVLHFRTLPSRGQKWEFKARCVGPLDHHLPSKPCPWGCCSVFWGWVWLSRHLEPPSWNDVCYVCGWNSPRWAWSFCTFVLAFSQLCARLLFLPVFISQVSSAGRVVPWVCLCSFPPAFSLYWKAVAVDTLASTLFALQTR